MRTPLSSVAAAALLLGACTYDYSNPAERLDGGEVTGRVVADSGGGAAGLAGVNVWLRNSASVQTTRDNGRFVLLGLMPGRHTVLFQKGDGAGNVTWAGSREVDVAWGSDGQPEGVILGDIQIRYPVTISGTVSVPTVGSFYPTAIFAYDDATGVPGSFLETFDPFGTVQRDSFSYAFRGLGVGAHQLRFALVGNECLPYPTFCFPTSYLAGPVTRDVASTQEGQTIPMTPLTLASAFGFGKLRFKVDAPPTLAGTYAYAATVTNAATGAVETCSAYSDGTRECDVAPGAYRIDVVTTPADGTFLDPPFATGIVGDGLTTDLGALYILDWATTSEASNACVFDADCGLDMACSGGQCVWALPACFAGDYSVECANWNAACFSTPFTTTPCNGGRGVCADGIAGQVCVPNGVSGCVEAGGEPFPVQAPICIP